MTAQHYDVVIAGAGPAGCAIAIKLREFDLNVCLLDDVDDSHLKVGESLPGAVIRLLAGLGIRSLDELLSSAEYEPCSANASAWGTDHWSLSDVTQNPEGGGWHILRHRFDAALRQVALDRGADFYANKIGRISTNNDAELKHTIAFKKTKHNIPAELHARWVVDATGRANAVLKQFGVERSHFEKQMAAICWLKPNAADLDKTTRVKSVENGWWYSSQLPDNSRVLSFHGLPDDVARMVRNTHDYLSEANQTGIISYTVEKQNILEGVIATNAGVSKPTQVAANGWLAVGDAALSFDPLSSQGIFFSLYSGIRGAEAIASVLKSGVNEAVATQQYTNKVGDVFAANQRSRKYHYTTELRYHSHAYWMQYLVAGKTLV